MNLFKFPRIQSSALLTGLIAAEIALIPNSALLAQSIPQKWESNQYQPPAFIGSPKRTVGGATRGPQNLTSLIPNNGFGVTTAAYPTFFVYLPAVDYEFTQYAEFLLLDQNGQEIYKVRFPTKMSDSIIRISLPTQIGMTPLEVGKNYQWKFNLYEDSSHDYLNTRVEGGIARVELESQLAWMLQNATSREKSNLYAENEIWYDALTTLADLYEENLNDPVVAADWEQLLTAVGLNQIVTSSLESISWTP